MGRKRSAKPWDKRSARFHKRLEESSVEVTVAARHCVNKAALNKAQARSRAASMCATGNEVVAYRCHRCGRWHVGHRPPGIDGSFYDENGSRVR